MSDFLTNRNAYFPKAVQDAAQHAERTTGCPACVTLAQWAVESAYGKEAPGNNPFGMKWSEGCGFPKQELKTEEFYGGKMHAEEDPFIAFPTLEAAFEAHGKYLMHADNQWPEYLKAQTAWRSRRDWKGFIQAMAPRYATDPNYTKILIGVVDQFHLQDLNLAKPAP